MSGEAEALSGKSSLVTDVLGAASASQPEESLEAAWARMQKSSTAQRVDVSYEQSKIEDKSVAAQDARLARFGLGVELNESVGRKLVARKAFTEGSCVLKVEPFAAALLPRCRERRCAHCFCSIEAGKRKKCGGCGHVVYCGPACQKKDWKSHHRRECDGGPALSAALNNDETAVSDAILACRAARRMRKNDLRSRPVGEKGAIEDVQLMLKFCTNEDDTRARAISRHCVAADWCAEPDAELVQKLIKASGRNNFCRQDDVLDEVSALLSPVGALLNHSCYPTTCVAYDAQGRQCFMACRSISEGDEITHSYVDCGVPTEQRRERLRSIYGFDCACERCTAPWSERDALLDGDEEGRSVSPQRLVRNERLRREAHETEGDEEASLLNEALAALGACSETHVHRIQTQQARAECALGSERYDDALELFREVAEQREKIYAPLPHARVALDYFTLYEIANWQGDARTARAARERARWHLERTAAPDDRRLEDLHVAAAITSNQTADLAEGMIGFSVDDGGDWEAPPEDDDVWEPVERGSE